MQITITLNSYEELEELRAILGGLRKKGTPMTDEEKARMRKFYEMFPPDPCPEDTPQKEEKPKRPRPKRQSPRLSLHRRPRISQKPRQTSLRSR